MRETTIERQRDAVVRRTRRRLELEDAVVRGIESLRSEGDPTDLLRRRRRKSKRRGIAGGQDDRRREVDVDGLRKIDAADKQIIRTDGKVRRQEPFDANAALSTGGL